MFVCLYVEVCVCVCVCMREGVREGGRERVLYVWSTWAWCDSLNILSHRPSIP